MRSMFPLFVTVGALALVGAASAAPRYIATDVGAFNEGFSLGQAVSSNGTVAGIAGISDSKYSLAERAFVKTVTGKIQPVTGNAYAQSYADGVNASGLVVGKVTQESQFSSTQHAFVAGAGMPVTLIGGDYGEAFAVNDAGQVVGGAGGTAFIWSKAGGFVDFGTFGGKSAYASAINAHGDVLAAYENNSNAYVPILVRAAGKRSKIAIPGAFDTRATALNASAQVVGSYTPRAQVSHSVAYVYDKKLVTLPTLHPEDTQSDAYGINDAGDIVGGDSTADGRLSPVIWTGAAHTPVDLNSLIDLASGIHITVAYAINNKGQITGYGRVAGQKDDHAVLLTPVN